MEKSKASTEKTEPPGLTEDIIKQFSEQIKNSEKLLSDISHIPEKTELGYIREDIRDLKQDIRENRKSIDDLRKETKADINSIRGEIDKLRNLLFKGFGFIAALITVFKYLM